MSETSQTGRGLPRFLTVASTLGLTVWLGRVALLAVLEARLRGGDDAFTLWQVGEDFGAMGLHAALAGVALALAGRARSGGARVALGLVGALVAATALAGWPWAERDQIPGAASTLGQLGLASIAAAALLLLWGAVRLTAVRLSASPLAAALSLAAFLAFPFAYKATLGARSNLLPDRTLPVRRVVHELAFEEDLWTAESYPRGGKPRAYVLTPSMDYRLDGGDMPALVMPPPAVVRFEVPGGEGALWLTGRTGVDLVGPRSLPKGVDLVRIGFSIEVDGEEVWRTRHSINRDRSKPGGLLWKDIPDLELQPGQEVTLRSELLEPADLERLPLIPMGFGSLNLEQRSEKPLMKATESSPNIVLFVTDTLRQDRLSCYGYERETTPHLDALAERGILYENAYSSASWTWPSTASILTGLYPETHGVLEDGECYLNNSVQTLPELLSERNYVTGAFTCNPLIVPNKNFDQGFDHFDSYHRFRHSRQVVGDVLDWIRLYAGTRFFLYIQFTDTHEKYDLLTEAVTKIGGAKPEGYPKAGLDEYHGEFLRGGAHDEHGHSIVEEVLTPEYRAWMQDAYDAAVITADHFVGQVLDELERQGVLDRTIVAFTSDHGEEILDHGMVTHGHTLYPELTRIPLILAGPGLPRGERVETPVSNRHLAPSLAAVGNAEFDLTQDPVDLKSPASVREQPIFFSTKQGWWNGKFRLDIYGVRHGEWELHWAPKGRDWGAEDIAPDGQARLYHVSVDPTTQRDVAAEHPERTTELLELLRAHVGRAIERRPKLTVGAGKRSHADLVGIGYIQTEEAEDEEEGSQ